MKTNGNEPITAVKDFAVRTETTKSGWMSDDFPGLTKREHFAAMAMQGLLANPNPGPIAMCAQMAIESADALITALNKETEASNG